MNRKYLSCQLSELYTYSIKGWEKLKQKFHLRNSFFLENFNWLSLIKNQQKVKIDSSKWDFRKFLIYQLSRSYIIVKSSENRLKVCLKIFSWLQAGTGIILRRFKEYFQYELEKLTIFFQIDFKIKSKFLKKA